MLYSFWVKLRIHAVFFCLKQLEMLADALLLPWLVSVDVHLRRALRPCGFEPCREPFASPRTLLLGLEIVLFLKRVPNNTHSTIAIQASRVLRPFTLA